MTPAERQFLMTTAWLFMRHGQPARALPLCAALVEDDPHDGVPAAALAQLLLDSGRPAPALEVLRAADFPPRLLHAEAVLEARALRATGKPREAAARWRRHLESRKGAARKWVAQPGGAAEG